MAGNHPFWVRLARKEPQCATVRGRVFEIGAPDERDGAFLLTVWEKGRPVGHVLNLDPLVYKPCGPNHHAEPRPVDGVEALLELLVPPRTPLPPSSSRPPPCRVEVPEKARSRGRERAFSGDSAAGEGG